MELRPIILETNRLTLKGFSPENMTSIFQNYSRDEIMELLGHHSEEEYQQEKSKQENGYAAYNRRFILFLLIEKASNIIIGRCGLHNWNKEHNRAEIGYNITEENFKRKGLMTEAVSAVIDFGFNDLKLHRIEAVAGSGNIPSLKILEKQRFVQEGLLRQHFCVSGKYEDSLILSKLYTEYIDGQNGKIRAH